MQRCYFMIKRKKYRLGYKRKITNHNNEVTKESGQKPNTF